MRFEGPSKGHNHGLGGRCEIWGLTKNPHNINNKVLLYYFEKSTVLGRVPTTACLLGPSTNSYYLYHYALDLFMIYFRSVSLFLIHSVFKGQHMVNNTITFIEIWGPQGKTSKGHGHGLGGRCEICGLSMNPHNINKVLLYYFEKSAVLGMVYTFVFEVKYSMQQNR